MKESKNLMEGLLEEISRVKEMVTEYKSLTKGAGIFASGFMEIDIRKAETAITLMNTVQMIASYKTLKEYSNQ